MGWTSPSPLLKASPPRTQPLQILQIIALSGQNQPGVLIQGALIEIQSSHKGIELCIFVESIGVYLGGLGVGYALWYDDLYIDGTVYTGDLDVGYYCSWGSCYDNETKDISSISKSRTDDTLTITINGAYPCVTYTCEFCVVTMGTLPVHFGPWVINRGTLPAGATVTVTPDLTGQQNYPDQHQECYITVHLDNDAAEGATYTFSVDLRAYQYNESPY